MAAVKPRGQAAWAGDDGWENDPWVARQIQKMLGGRPISSLQVPLVAGAPGQIEVEATDKKSFYCVPRRKWQLVGVPSSRARQAQRQPPSSQHQLWPPPVPHLVGVPPKM
eukprot:CAMPEP_0115572920 /NCGR_PEP_ID=MMETSP0272-20121206/727_1 /TAXON_ID=71861 /ORGANISM="Scrippsiella trochoidea, Strain CCMP3099" /LENGTH=109 /DNA_ID=CAMNT_0003007559 /DNA_START=98 /DNA_END=428 /DNA_ORIENTATION=-